MSKKKILFFTPTLGSGGSERQMVTLAVLFKQKGYDTQFFCLSSSFNFHLNTLKLHKIPVYFAKTKQSISRRKPISTLLSKFNTRKEFCKYVDSNKIDVVISFLKPCNSIAAKTKKIIQGFKLITGERSYDSLLFKNDKRYIQSQQYADAIVCNSNQAKELWQKNCPLYDNKLFTIYNIVTLGSISTDYFPRQDGKLHVMVAASYLYYKNLIGFVNALKLMTAEERDVIVIDWYGSFKTADVTFKNCKEEIKNFGLDNSLLLHDATSEIADRQNSADVVALISQVEGLPNAICEAMTIGKPILMSRVSDYDTLVDDSNGLLVDWNNPATIKEALLVMSKWTTEELIQKGLSSKEKAMRLFTAENIIPQWEQMFEIRH